jgi:hypothetical protein
MGLLSLNTIPSELLAGSVFAANFESTVRVIQNGGVLTGTPLVDRGITLNGVDESVHYFLQGNEFNSVNISIVIEFYPDFDYDIDANIYFIDATNGSRYYVYKGANGASNVLGIGLANTGIAAIPSATYSPYWNVGQKNTLVISGTSGDTSAWLNGNLILDSDSSVWSPSADTMDLYVGSRYISVALKHPRCSSLLRSDSRQCSR